MKCNERFDQLEAYADGELSRAERAELEGHLQACSTCRERLEKLQVIRRCVRDSLAEPIPAPDLADSIMANLPSSRTPLVRRWALGWAVGLVMGLLVGWIVRGPGLAERPALQSSAPANWSQRAAAPEPPGYKPGDREMMTAGPAEKQVVTVVKVVYRDRNQPGVRRSTPGRLPRADTEKTTSRAPAEAQEETTEESTPFDGDLRVSLEGSPGGASRAAYTLPPNEDAEHIERPPLPGTVPPRQSGI